MIVNEKKGQYEQIRLKKCLNLQPRKVIVRPSFVETLESGICLYSKLKSWAKRLITSSLTNPLAFKESRKLMYVQWKSEMTTKTALRSEGGD